MLCDPKQICGNLADSIVGACAPSFSAQVRFGEPGAPVLFLWGSAMTQTPGGTGPSFQNLPSTTPGFLYAALDTSAYGIRLIDSSKTTQEIRVRAGLLSAVPPGLSALVKARTPQSHLHVLGHAHDLDLDENVFSFNSYRVNCNSFLRVCGGPSRGIE
jgi:hypothetical protein